MRRLVLADFARVNPVPAVVAVVVTAIHVDTRVGRVPDVGAALRRRGLGAELSGDLNASGELDIDTQVELVKAEEAGLEGVGLNLSVDVSGRNGGGKGSEDEGLHFECWLKE